MRFPISTRPQRTALAGALLAALLFSNPVAGEPTLRRAPARHPELRRMETVTPAATEAISKPDERVDGSAPDTERALTYMPDLPHHMFDMMQPDLVIHVAQPASPSLHALLTIQNIGPEDVTQPFQVYTYAKGSCEAGKLTSPMGVVPALKTINSLDAGQSTSIALFPSSSSSWSAGGCYVVITSEVDMGQLIGELSESNNKDTTYYCPSGSCY